MTDLSHLPNGAGWRPKHAQFSTNLSTGNVSISLALGRWRTDIVGVLSDNALRHPSPHPARTSESALFSIIQAAGWPIWPLIACSVVALTLVIERMISLRRSRVVPPQLLDEALAVSSRGLPPPDVLEQLAQNSALGEVLASGLRAAGHRGADSQDLQAAMEGAGREVAHRLERYLSALATIASAAPLLGLLGTVIGLIEIFGSQTPGNTGSNPAQLAQGISIALYNTAFGLIVAIPSLIFWRLFRARVDGYVLAMELAAERFARHLAQLRPR